PNRNSYSIIGTTKPLAGTYEFAAALACPTAQYLNNNEFIIGYYMIINE
ncbi:MAG: hypothetical protein JNJ57_00575, partial [Saprospiraceae bacterium]|nr:hypothetical protein [Saprospiraceae bacterium]